MFKASIKKSRFLLFLIFSLIICLSLSGPALAAGEPPTAGHGAESHEGVGSGEHGGGHGDDTGAALKDLRNRFINFILLVIILVLVFKKSGAGSFLSGRIEEIKRQMEDLARERDESEKKFQDIQQQLREFEESKQEIIDQFVSEGQAEKEKIIAEAEDRAKQIVSQAEITIEHEMTSAMDKLKQELMGQAAEKARELMAEELTDEDQDKLVDDFIERVGKVN
jgi:F-type H+-transporting ATPase subunit b